MIYTSKKKGFLDFLKTGNWKYYTAFFVLFIAIIAVIITISAFQLSTAIGLYWITSSLFTVIQNMLVVRSGNHAKIKK